MTPFPEITPARYVTIKEARALINKAKSCYLVFATKDAQGNPSQSAIQSVKTVTRQALKVMPEGMTVKVFTHVSRGAIWIGG